MADLLWQGHLRHVPPCVRLASRHPNSVWGAPDSKKITKNSLSTPELSLLLRTVFAMVGRRRACVRIKGQHSNVMGRFAWKCHGRCCVAWACPHDHVRTEEYKVAQGSHKVIMRAVSTPCPTFVRAKVLRHFRYIIVADIYRVMITVKLYSSS
jgi:hypothetical protein